MPGNKNSGRKKIVREETIPIPITPLPNKKVGRPKKEVSKQKSTEISTIEDEIIGDEGNLLFTCDVATEKPDKQSSSSRASNLKRRNSDINKVYDLFLGPSLHKFPSSKLPQQSVVLQRYRALLTQGGHNTLQNEIITTITK